MKIENLNIGDIIEALNNGRHVYSDNEILESNFLTSDSMGGATYKIMCRDVDADSEDRFVFANIFVYEKDGKFFAGF